jgi:predicted GTPase
MEVILDLAAQEKCRDRILELANRFKKPCRLDLSQSRQIIRQLESIGGSFHGVSIFGALRDEIRSITSRLNSIDKDPLKLAIIGEFSAGKSSLINALVGSDDFLPVNISETTALVSKLEYALFKGVKICFKNGTHQDATFDDYRNLVDENKISSIRDDIDLVSVAVDYPPLKKITIFDTPGLNSKIEKHERTTINYISEVEVVFWVFRADKPAAGTELGYIEKIKNRKCKVYGIINKIDAIRGYSRDEERWNSEMERVMNAFQKNCGSIIEQFIPVSAKEAIKGILSDDVEKIKRSQISAVQNVIENEITNKATVIKTEYLHDMVELFTGIGEATKVYFDEIFKSDKQLIVDVLGKIQTCKKELETYSLQSHSNSQVTRMKAPWEYI